MAVAALAVPVDAHSPWLGLASFSEETSAYFHGREEEVAELARRVQRKLLTVLFGQSGLGKTSILRAGLAPKLRAQGYLPVYVRIDYATDAPEPADQIKHAIAEAAQRAGEWSQAGVATAGESLWEFLHHRDDVLKDAAGRTLIPLLIFDQFEEIFTLAQNDDAGRARATRFIADLADLVENRPPRELEARFEADESMAERFDFARSDYRVLIALREDYLAPLENLKRSMPSISQNRLRLAPMTGTQALAAVLEPGRGLLDEEVAEAIVRFVAGGAELQNAEVEPALLSLVCRELNDARLAAQRPQISPDLLEGSQDTILSNFYERSLADQPPAVRQVIEEQLLTASGFRENIAEERLLAAFRVAGAPPETLSVLVNRRLLRVEERLDLRRVELTHDVLTGVVRTSRDARQERETREASDRLLAEQRAREIAARRALVRARQVATVCGVLALAAVVAAGVAVTATLRAKRAEAATQGARVQAENLVGYLSDDFTRELFTYGQQSTISNIAKRQIDYFRGLPASLKGPESIRNGANALIVYARAERSLGHGEAARTAALEAVDLMERARAGGDDSVATRIVQSRAYSMLGNVQNTNADPHSLESIRKALALIEPLAAAPGAPPAARHAWAQALGTLGYAEAQYSDEFPNALIHLAKARELAADDGAREVKTVDATARWVGAAVWEAEVFARLGRADEAYALDVEGDRLGRLVLQKRPDYLSVLHDLAIMDLDLGTINYMRLNPAEGVVWAKRAWEISQRSLQRDPNNSSSINNASVNLLALADLSWALGDTAASFEYARQADAMFHPVEKNGAWFVLNSLTPVGQLGQRLADAGHEAEARRMEAKVGESVESLSHSPDIQTDLIPFTRCLQRFTEMQISQGLGDFKAVRAQARDARQQVANLKVNAPFVGLLKSNCDYYAPLAQSEAELWLNEPGAALATVREANAIRGQYPVGGQDEQRAESMSHVLEAWALARLGRLPEAREVLAPQAAYQRKLAGTNQGDCTQFYDFAATLYVESLTDPAHAGALRREALAALDRLPAAFRQLRSTSRVRAQLQRG